MAEFLDFFFEQLDADKFKKILNFTPKYHMISELPTNKNISDKNIIIKMDKMSGKLTKITFEDIKDELGNWKESTYWFIDNGKDEIMLSDQETKDAFIFTILADFKLNNLQHFDWKATLDMTTKSKILNLIDSIELEIDDIEFEDYIEVVNLILDDLLSIEGIQKINYEAKYDYSNSQLLKILNNIYDINLTTINGKIEKKMVLLLLLFKLPNFYSSSKIAKILFKLPDSEYYKFLTILRIPIDKNLDTLENLTAVIEDYFSDPDSDFLVNKLYEINEDFGKLQLPEIYDITFLTNDSLKLASNFLFKIFDDVPPKVFKKIILNLKNNNSIDVFNKKILDKYFLKLGFNVNCDDINYSNYGIYFRLFKLAIYYYYFDEILFKSDLNFENKIFNIVGHGEDINLELDNNIINNSKIDRIDLLKLNEKYTTNIEFLNLQPYGKYGLFNHDVKLMKSIGNFHVYNLFSNISEDKLSEIDTFFQDETLSNLYPNKKVNGPRNFDIYLSDSVTRLNDENKGLFSERTNGVLELALLNSHSITLLQKYYRKLKKNYGYDTDISCNYNIDCTSNKCTSGKCAPYQKTMSLPLIYELERFYALGKEIVDPYSNPRPSNSPADWGISESLKKKDLKIDDKILFLLDLPELFVSNIDKIKGNDPLENLIIDKMIEYLLTSNFLKINKAIYDEFRTLRYSVEKNHEHNKIKLSRILELILQNVDLDSTKKITIINGSCRFPTNWIEADSSGEELNVNSTIIAKNKLYGLRNKNTTFNTYVRPYLEKVYLAKPKKTIKLGRNNSNKIKTALKVQRRKSYTNNRLNNFNRRLSRKKNSP